MAREYAFLMIDYEMPSFIKDLQNKIPNNELYFGTDEEKKDNQYGFEKESHVTLAPCLDSDVDINKKHPSPCRDECTAPAVPP